MIDFSRYIGKHIVLVTNFNPEYEALSGIRISNAQLFKFKGKWVIARPLTKSDVDDEDFICFLESMWHHDEVQLKAFVKSSMTQIKT